MATPADPPTALTRARAGFVTDRLLVGGDLDSIDPALARAQLDELVRRGVTHILDTRLEWSDEEYVAQHAPTMAYLHLGVDDDGGTLPDAWFDRATAWLDEALAQPDARALVHCHMGVNRSPSLVFAYLLHRGLGVRQALDAIRAAWPIAVIDYADDALAWHHRRTDAPERARRADLDDLAQWRDEHGIDPEQVIRSIRQDESVRLTARNLGLVADVMRSDPSAMRCWLFQLDAERARRCLEDYRAGVDSWILPIGPNAEEPGPDDVILLWQSGPDDDQGLIGYAMVNETGLPPGRDWGPNGGEQASSAVDADLAFVAPQALVTPAELLQAPGPDEDPVNLSPSPDQPNPVPLDAAQVTRIAELLRAKAAH